MDIQTSINADKATLRIKGRFQFDSHREFRSAYEPLIANPAVRVVVLDFSAGDYLDSSALGMLLMLRDKMGGANKDVALTGVRGNVKQVLDIANFGKLFQIS